MTKGRLVCALALAAAFFPTSGAATGSGPDPVGRYRAAAGPDLASELVIEANGHFEYVLYYGALDEHAAGHWTRADGGIRLYTDPKPVPAAFALDAPSKTGDAKFSLLVAWPDGRGIAGIDFRIGFASGDPITGYTQEDGWSLSPDEQRSPTWIELVEPIHGVSSPRFPIDLEKGNALHFTLTPNDIDVFDFQGTPVDVEAGALVMHRNGAMLKYVRQTEETIISP